MRAEPEPRSSPCGEALRPDEMRPADFCHSHQPREHPHLPCFGPRRGLRPARLEDPTFSRGQTRLGSAHPVGLALVRRLPGGKTEPRTPLSPPSLVRPHLRATFGSGAAEIASPVARVNETRAPRSRTPSIGQMPFAGLHRDTGFAAVPRFIALFAHPQFPDRACARSGSSGFARPPSPREAFATRASLGPALPADFCNTKQLRARPGPERSSPHTRP